MLEIFVGIELVLIAWVLFMIIHPGSATRLDYLIRFAVCLGMAIQSFLLAIANINFDNYIEGFISSIAMIGLVFMAQIAYDDYIKYLEWQDRVIDQILNIIKEENLKYKQVDNIVDGVK